MDDEVYDAAAARHAALQRLLDEQEIHQLLVRYCRGRSYVPLVVAIGPGVDGAAAEHAVWLRPRVHRVRRRFEDCGPICRAPPSAQHRRTSAASMTGSSAWSVCSTPPWSVARDSRRSLHCSSPDRARSQLLD